MVQVCTDSAVPTTYTKVNSLIRTFRVLVNESAWISTNVISLSICQFVLCEPIFPFGPYLSHKAIVTCIKICFVQVDIKMGVTWSLFHVWRTWRTSRTGRARWRTWRPPRRWWSCSKPVTPNLPWTGHPVIIYRTTVIPMHNDHPRDPKIVVIDDRWSLFKGHLNSKV